MRAESRACFDSFSVDIKSEVFDCHQELEILEVSKVMFIKIAKVSSAMSTDKVFDVIDKTGRKIRLTRRQFQHVICHKGMENYIEEMKDALIHPLKIASHEAGELYDYYKHYKNRNQKAKFLQVVVKYLNGEGFVLTAYFVGHI